MVGPRVCPLAMQQARTEKPQTGCTVYNKDAAMFYIGATDQRVSVVNDAGVEVYHADLRNLVSIITHLRGRIAAAAISSPTGQMDQNMLSVLEQQLKLDPTFKSLHTMPFSPGLDARLLALAALVAATTERDPKKKKKKDKKAKKD